MRLTVAGGREAVVRLVAIALAVALGVGVLLVSLAGINAVHAQPKRTAWLTASINDRVPRVPGATVDPLWAMLALDQYGASTVDRVDVAATGPRSPVPPGIPRLPGPGEFYASPALARLLARTPAAELGDRYPGRQVGTIGDSALESPDSLVIIIGHTPDELSSTGQAEEIRSFNTASSDVPGNPHPGRMQLILAVVAGAILIPVILFIAAATRLAAARREQRFAAMRLVGATPSQISVIAAMEAAVATLAGVAAGMAVFLVLRPFVARVPFTGQPFFPSDLSLHVADIALVAAGVPVAAAVAARVALRRVLTSPLGVARRATTSTPRAWRVLPLLAGIGELTWFIGRRPTTTTGQIRAYGTGFFLALLALVVAGPWLTMVASRLLARRARRPAALIAARRLADNPRAAFRAVSGLIVALFVCSAALGIITTILTYHSATTGGAAARAVLSEQLGNFNLKINGEQQAAGATVPATLLDTLASIPGVRAVAEIHVDPSAPFGPGTGPPTGLISCAELSRFPVLGRCAPGAAVASIAWDGPAGGITSTGRTPATVFLPPAGVTESSLEAFPVAAVDVSTDGSARTIETARTAVEAAFPYSGPPVTLGDISVDNAQLIAGWRQLADVAIVASLVIAACSMAVCAASSLIERKRPFSLLRLAGAPLAVLRRVVALEAALPLIIVAATAAGTGLLAAHLFLRSQLSESLQPPGGGYYLAVAAGIALALGIIAATLPLLERVTGPETARNE
jgi:hypothetical protein